MENLKFQFRQGILFAVIFGLISCHSPKKSASNEQNKEYKFYELKAVVNPTKSLIHQGDQYEAEIFLAAVGKTDNIQYFVEGQELETKQGKAYFNEAGYRIGTRVKNGYARVPTANGYQQFPFEIRYEVQRPYVDIVPVEMNVLYEGISNPMSIYVSGSEDIILHATEGLRLDSLGSGRYNAYVDGSTRQVKISAAVKKDGMTRLVGSQMFRVRKLPSPNVQLGGIMNTGAPVAKAVARANSTSLLAYLESSFPYSLKYRVTSFKFTHVSYEGVRTELEGKGHQLTKKMKKLIENSKSRDMIMFTEILVDHEDDDSKRIEGSNVEASPVVLQIK